MSQKDFMLRRVRAVLGAIDVGRFSRRIVLMSVFSISLSERLRCQKIALLRKLGARRLRPSIMPKDHFRCVREVFRVFVLLSSALIRIKHRILFFISRLNRRVGA